MRRSIKILTMISVAGLMSACASTPEVEEAPVVEAPVEQPVLAAPTPDPTPVVTAPPVVEENIPVPGSTEDFLYRTGGDARIYFAYNQYDLSVQALDTLRAQANWLNTYQNVTAVIEGNADERGTREYNLALGARRAESVKDFLVSQGVAASRLTTVSYGKERPIDPRSNEEGWARNRNGHTNLMSGTIG